MSFNLLAPAVFYRYTASKHTQGHHISTTFLALPRSGFHQLATTFVKLLPFLDHELVSQQVGRVTFNLFQPLIHHDHRDPGSGNRVFVRQTGRFCIRVFFFTRTRTHLIKLVHGLASSGLLLGYFFRCTTRTGWLFRRAAGFFPVPFFFPSSSVAGFLWRSSIISIVYR